MCIHISKFFFYLSVYVYVCVCVCVCVCTCKHEFMLISQTLIRHYRFLPIAFPTCLFVNSFSDSEGDWGLTIYNVLTYSFPLVY